MDYVECYFGCGEGMLFLGLLIAIPIASFVVVRRRAWTLIGALVGVPLAEWYLDGVVAGLVILVALLLGGLVGLAFTPKPRTSTTGEAA